VGAATACCEITKGVAPDFIFYVYVWDALDKFDSRKAGGKDFILRKAKVIARLLATAVGHIATAKKSAASMGGGNINCRPRNDLRQRSLRAIICRSSSETGPQGPARQSIGCCYCSTVSSTKVGT